MKTSTNETLAGLTELDASSLDEVAGGYFPPAVVAAAAFTKDVISYFGAGVAIGNGINWVIEQVSGSAPTPVDTGSRSSSGTVVTETERYGGDHFNQPSRGGDYGGGGDSRTHPPDLLAY